MLAGRDRRLLDRQRPAPRVAQRPGGRADRRASVRETVPDEELASADEIVLVDLPPEDLIARLRAGKVYPPPRVAPALNGFFRVENLRALREVALRQLAENVEDRRRRRAADRRAAAGVRRPRRARRARRPARVALRPAARRRARRARGRRGRSRRRRERERLEALRRLTAMLGAHLLVEEGDELEVLARVARERGTTYILLGPPSRARPAASRSRWSCGSSARSRTSTSGSSPAATAERQAATRAVRAARSCRRASSAPARAVAAYSAMASRPRVENGALRAPPRAT